MGSACFIASVVGAASNWSAISEKTTKSGRSTLARSRHSRIIRRFFSTRSSPLDASFT
jgi:hypothetical protein